jgi:hypothetical protein
MIPAVALCPFSRHDQRVVFATRPAQPRRLDGRKRSRAHPAALGFTADNGIDEVVQAFIEDDLAMQKRLV